MIPSFLEEISLWKKRNKMPRGHTACLCKNSTQFLETVFRVWNTKYLNNLVYLLIFQKLSNFSQLATLSPFVASVFEEKNEKNYLLYSDTCISCIEWLSTSAAFLLCKRVNEVHNLFKSRSISNQTVNWRRWRESVWNEFIQWL